MCLLVSCEEILLEEEIIESEFQLFAPSENSTVKTSHVHFTWSAVEGGRQYQIQIAAPDFQAPMQVITKMVEENQTSVDLNEGNYEWRVQATNSGYETPFSLPTRFKVALSDNFSDQALALISPPEGYVSPYQKVELTWRAIEEAGLYRIQIIEEGEVIQEEITSEMTIQVDFPEGESNWKVRAENEAQNTLFAERTITIDTRSPNVPELISPADEEELTGTEVSFIWRREAIDGTGEVDSLFIFGDQELQELVEKARVNSSYDITLERDSTYYWYVKAYDEAGNQSAESEFFSFSTK